MAKRDQFYIELGERVRGRREELGLTQAELARSIGISRTSLTNIECGRQRVLVDQLAGLSRRLLVSPADLIPADEEKATAAPNRLADMPVVASFVESVFSGSTR